MCPKGRVLTTAAGVIMKRTGHGGRNRGHVQIKNMPTPLFIAVYLYLVSSRKMSLGKSDPFIWLLLRIVSALLLQGSLLQLNSIPEKPVLREYDFVVGE